MTEEKPKGWCHVHPWIISALYILWCILVMIVVIFMLYRNPKAVLSLDETESVPIDVSKFQRLAKHNTRPTTTALKSFRIMYGQQEQYLSLHTTKSTNISICIIPGTASSYQIATSLNGAPGLVIEKVASDVTVSDESSGSSELYIISVKDPLARFLDAFHGSCSQVKQTANDCYGHNGDIVGFVGAFTKRMESLRSSKENMMEMWKGESLFFPQTWFCGITEHITELVSIDVGAFITSSEVASKTLSQEDKDHYKTQLEADPKVLDEWLLTYLSDYIHLNVTLSLQNRVCKPCNGTNACTTRGLLSCSQEILIYKKLFQTVKSMSIEDLLKGYKE